MLLELSVQTKSVRGIGVVLFAVLVSSFSLLLGGCVPEISEHPPPSEIISQVHSLAPVANGCQFSENAARTVIVRIILLDGSFWRGASNGRDNQVFRRSTNPIWTSGFEVPAYGQFSVFFEYRMDCDPCCGPFGAPVFTESFPFEDQRNIYTVGDGSFRFDHCEDCL